MRLPATIALVVSCGCGAIPTFGGQYSGSLSQASTCSDGSSGTAANRQVWTIRQNGSSGTLTIEGCGSQAVDLGNATAEVAPMNCDLFTDPLNGWTWLFVVTSGSMTLKGEALTIQESLTSNFSTPGGASGSCVDTDSGILVLSGGNQA